MISIVISVRFVLDVSLSFPFLRWTDNVLKGLTMRMSGGVLNGVCGGGLGVVKVKSSDHLLIPLRTVDVVSLRSSAG